MTIEIHYSARGYIKYAEYFLEKYGFKRINHVR